MKRYYCPTITEATPCGSYYLEGVHKKADIPKTAIEISEELFQSLQGFEIEPGPDGLPRRKVQPAPTIEQRAAALLVKVDAFMDAKAQERGYDNIAKAALRAALPNSPYHEEGIVYGEWMDAVYSTCYSLLAQVKAGEIEEPNEAELMGMLPALVLPPQIQPTE